MPSLSGCGAGSICGTSRSIARCLHTTLLLSGKLNSHLAQIDNRAAEMFDRLVKQLTEKQGITEQLKALNQMAWVGAMNNIHNTVEEIVLYELIYA